MGNMKYPGKELEIFDKATIWRKYIYALTKKFLSDGMLEIGAGLGSFTTSYFKNFHNITLTELDEHNIKILKSKFLNKNGIEIREKNINELEGKFNTIIYLNVLEHIQKDQDEINSALDKLKLGGHLIILVPAHQSLYSKFDEAIGHCRRYSMNFFTLNKFENAKIEIDFFFNN